jgi:hypothetical protein
MAILNDLPNLNATLVTLTLFFKELFVIGTSRGKLIGERMEIYRKDTVFEPVPADVWGFNTHLWR